MYWNDPDLIRLFGGLIICFLSLTGIIIAIFRINKITKKHLLLPLYFTLVISQIQFSEYSIASKKNTILGIELNKISVGLYIPFELILLSSILYFCVKSKKIKSFIFLANISHAIVTALCWKLIEKTDTYITLISTLESFILVVPAVYYFYEIAKRPPILQLNKEPSFWISTGVLFFVIIITPFTLILPLIPFEIRQTLDFLGYLIIISLFIKAITCSHP